MLSLKLRKGMATFPEPETSTKQEEADSSNAYVSSVEVVKRPAVTSMVMKQASPSTFEAPSSTLSSLTREVVAGDFADFMIENIGLQHLG